MEIPADNQETREMKTPVQLSLYIVAAVSVLWGVALFMSPEAVQGVLSRGPYDPAATGLVGATMFAFALWFFIAAMNPMKPLVNASALALGLYAVAAVFLMFLSTGMPRNLWTFFTMLLYASIALILFFSTLEPRTVPARRPGRAGRRRPRGSAASQRKAGAGRSPAARRSVRSSKSGSGTSRGRAGRKRRR